MLREPYSISLPGMSSDENASVLAKRPENGAPSIKTEQELKLTRLCGQQASVAITCELTGVTGRVPFAN